MPVPGLINYIVFELGRKVTTRPDKNARLPAGRSGHPSPKGIPMGLSQEGKGL